MIKKIRISLEMFLCWLITVLYIVGGNSMTVNFGERLPLKIAEIISIPFVLFEIIKYREIRLKPVSRQILFWICLGTISLVIKSFQYHYEPFDIIYGTLYSVRLIYMVILVDTLAICFQKHGYSVYKVMSMLLKCYLFVCIIGIFQLVFFPVAHDWYRVFFNMGFYFPNPDPHQGRLISTYFDPNYLAACLSIPLCISLYFGEVYRKQKYVIYSAVFIMICILTVSRSGFLAIAIVIIIMLIKRQYTQRQLLKNMVFIMAAITAVVMMYLNGARIIERILNSSSDMSTFSRFATWTKGWNIIRKNLGIGTGYNMVGAYVKKVLGGVVSNSTGYGNDSSLIVIIETTGIVGFVYFIGILIYNARKTHVYGMQKKLVIQMVIPALVCCNFNNLLFYPLWLFPLLLVVYMIAYYSDTSQSQPVPLEESGIGLERRKNK